jgi:hypothetical protein
MNKNTFDSICELSRVVSVKWWKSHGGDISASSAVKCVSLNCLLSCFQLSLWFGQIIAAVDATQHDLAAAQQAV